MSIRAGLRDRGCFHSGLVPVQYDGGERAIDDVKVYEEQQVCGLGVQAVCANYR